MFTLANTVSSLTLKKETFVLRRIHGLTVDLIQKDKTKMVGFGRNEKRFPILKPIRFAMKVETGDVDRYIIELNGQVWSETTKDVIAFNTSEVGDCLISFFRSLLPRCVSSFLSCYRRNRDEKAFYKKHSRKRCNRSLADTVVLSLPHRSFLTKNTFLSFLTLLPPVLRLSHLLSPCTQSGMLYFTFIFHSTRERKIDRGMNRRMFCSECLFFHSFESFSPFSIFSSLLYICTLTRRFDTLTDWMAQLYLLCLQPNSKEI